MTLASMVNRSRLANVGSVVCALKMPTRRFTIVTVASALFVASAHAVVELVLLKPLLPDIIYDGTVALDANLICAWLVPLRRIVELAEGEITCKRILPSHLHHSSHACDHALDLVFEVTLYISRRSHAVHPSVVACRGERGARFDVAATQVSQGIHDRT